MHPSPATWRSRVYLPQGIRVRSRVVLGIACLFYLTALVLIDIFAITTPMPGTTTLGVVLFVAINVAWLSGALLSLDTVLRTAYLEGTVVVVRRVFGIRRRDVARAPAVCLEHKMASLRFSVLDESGRRWLLIRLRPETYRRRSTPHPFLLLADAILAGPPRPEPAARAAWEVAQQLRQLAADHVGAP
jgi:hypothetical protein